MNGYQYAIKNGYNPIVTKRTEQVDHITEKYFYTTEVIEYNISEYFVEYDYTDYFGRKHHCRLCNIYATPEQALNGGQGEIKRDNGYNVKVVEQVAEKFCIVKHRKARKKVGR